MAYKDQEKKRAWQESWRLKYPEKEKAYQAKYKKTEGYVAKRLKYLYGLELSEYREMLEQQHNRCAICCDPFSPSSKPHVDHCHKTEKVRAILCNFCNQGISRFKDSPSICRSAADYLESHQ